MIFFLNLLLSVFYCNIVDRLRCRDYLCIKEKKFPDIYLPLILFWTFFCGSQFEVGTDYSAYINIFNGNNLDYFYKNGEILFFALVKLNNIIGVKGQFLFYIIYSICFYFLFRTISYVNLKYTAVFILLYIALSTVFNNQFNTIRQCLSIYIGTYGAMFAIGGKRLRAIFLFGIASLFHISSIIFVIFLLPKKVLHKLNESRQILLMVIGIIGSLFLSPTMANSFIPFLPKTYGWYIEGDNLGSHSIITSVTKYIFTPLYILAVHNYSKMNLNKTNEIIFKWGIIGFTIRLLTLNLPLINRLSMAFILVSMFPIYFYLVYLIKERKQKTFEFITLLIFFFYAVKVILFPVGEYNYKSIFFI